MAVSVGRGGLTAKAVGLSAVAGALLFLSAAIFGLAGSYRLANEESKATDAARLRLAAARVETLVHEAEDVGRAASLLTESAPTRAALKAALAPLVAPGVVDRIVVLSPGDRPLVSAPSSADDSVPSAAGATPEGVLTVSEADGAVWLAVSTTEVERPRVLVRIGARTLEKALSQGLDDPSSAMLLVENGRVLASAGATGSVPSSASGAKTLSSAGAEERVFLPLQDAPDMRGIAMSLDGVTRARGWRLFLLRTQWSVTSDALRAIAPSLAVLILGGAGAVVSVAYLSGRWAAPLRSLERAGIRIVQGEHVRPLVADRRDELGRVTETFNRMAARLSAFQDLVRLLAAATDTQGVLEAVAQAADHILGTGRCAVYLLHGGSPRLVPAHVVGVDGERVGAIDPSVEVNVRNAIGAGAPTIVSGTVNELSETFPGLCLACRHVLVAPLAAGYELLGLVVAPLDDSHRVGAAEMEMMDTFVGQAGLALHNSLMFEAERESRRTAEVLREIAEHFGGHGSLKRSISSVVPLVVDLLGASSGRMAFADRAALGLGPSGMPELDAAILGLARSVADKPTSPALSRAGSDLPGSDIAERMGVEEVLVIGVNMQGGQAGALALGFSAHPIRDREIQLAESVASAVGLAVENVYLFRQALARAHNLETIVRVSETVSSSLEVDVVLEQVLDVVERLLSADGAALLVHDPVDRSLFTKTSRGVVPDSLHGHLPSGEDVCGLAFTSAEPVILKRLEPTMRGLAGEAAALGMGALVAVPLRARGRVVGVLVAFVKRAGFGAEDVSVLRTFASQAALAFDTASLYSREHRLSQTLQQSLLPDALPSLPGVDSCSVYQPAGGDAEIGGDYYDLISASDGSTWFAIADVCGKGVSAAAKTSMIKHSVRAFVAAGFGPGELVAAVNAMVSAKEDASDIVTLLAGRILPSKRSVEWANAGHPPGLVRRHDGIVQRMVATGPLLGASRDAAYSQKRMALEGGEVILLYTDGVTEARRSGVFFGEERVIESLQREEMPYGVAHTLLWAVREFSGDDLRDDVAMLVLRVI